MEFRFASGQQETTLSRLIWLTVPALAVISSLVHLAGLSTPVSPDTPSYFLTFSEMFRRNLDDACLRTPVYGWIMACTSGLHLSGLALVSIQIVIRAAACTLTAVSIGTYDKVAGLTVGILLALDLTSAANSTAYITESLSTSGQLLCFALLVIHPKSSLLRRPGFLFSAGLFTGFTLLVRPTGWVFMPPVFLVLSLRLRSLVKPFLFAAGFSLVVGVIVLSNGLRTGYYGTARSGLYMSFPVFVHHLFSPDNGPASRTLDTVLRTCHPDLDYRRISQANVNIYVHQVFDRCLNEHFSGSDRDSWKLYEKVYAEAVISRPALFAERMLVEALLFGYGPAADWVYQLARQPAEETEKWCSEEGTNMRPALRSYICPLPEHSPKVRLKLAEAAYLATGIYQPYLSLAKYYGSTVLGAVALLFGYFIVVLTVAGRHLRLPVVLAVFFLALNALMTAAGQYVLSRYVSMAAPFYLVITGIFAVSVAGRIAGMRGRIPVKNASCREER